MEEILHLPIGFVLSATKNALFITQDYHPHPYYQRLKDKRVGACITKKDLFVEMKNKPYRLYKSVLGGGG